MQQEKQIFTFKKIGKEEISADIIRWLLGNKDRSEMRALAIKGAKLRQESFQTPPSESRLVGLLPTKDRFMYLEIHSTRITFLVRGKDGKPYIRERYLDDASREPNLTRADVALALIQEEIQ